MYSIFFFSEFFQKIYTMKLFTPEDKIKFGNTTAHWKKTWAPHYRFIVTHAASLTTNYQSVMFFFINNHVKTSLLWNFLSHFTKQKSDHFYHFILTIWSELHQQFTAPTRGKFEKNYSGCHRIDLASSTQEVLFITIFSDLECLITSVTILTSTTHGR